MTPLSFAAACGYVQSMEILLDAGAKLDPLALFYAIGLEDADTESLKLLAARGANLNFASKRWGAPLFYAVKRRNKAALGILLECGADPNVEHYGQTAAEIARGHGETELAEILEERMKRRSKRQRNLKFMHSSPVKVSRHKKVRGQIY
jgi:ankyrin repeat protein